MLMRLMTVFGLALLLTAPSADGKETDLSAFGARPPSDIINQNRYPKLVLKDLMSLWNLKCPFRWGAVNDCYLTEKDVDPRGSSEKLLIFRGETGVFEHPATSSYFRHYIKNSTICSPDCTREKINSKFQEDVQGMTLDLSPPTYFISPGVWKTKYGQAPSYKVKSPLREVAIWHLRGYGLYFESPRTLFDPFISFSANPATAANFTGSWSGPIFVASIPKDRLEILSEEDCDSNSYEATKLYVLQACRRDYDTSSEFEISAMFYLPAEYLYSVVTQ